MIENRDEVENDELVQSRRRENTSDSPSLGRAISAVSSSWTLITSIFSIDSICIGRRCWSMRLMSACRVPSSPSVCCSIRRWHLISRVGHLAVV
ncbi:hypothetical protein PsorP6_001693 [Peronosclerospora sorghi]|uniref:Uncharacterized protein n=1 Tax=Peronosclerospora sorghi TaxID=230839 RepID=A0ACC0WSF7_9STRA|nr:hypothetical protein PsorP6_001693 [Peronosclerospora sorghi]